MSITVLIASHLATASIGAVAIAFVVGGKVQSLRDKYAQLQQANDLKNKQLVAISALETPGAAAAAKKMAAIARGTHPLVRELGKSPIAPRAAVVAPVIAARAPR